MHYFHTKTPKMFLVPQTAFPQGRRYLVSTPTTPGAFGASTLRLRCSLFSDCVIIYNCNAVESSLETDRDTVFSWRERERRLRSNKDQSDPVYDERDEAPARRNNRTAYRIRQPIDNCSLLLRRRSLLRCLCRLLELTGTIFPVPPGARHIDADA